MSKLTLTAFQGGWRENPTLMIRIIIGTLLLLNLVAAYFALFPAGGSEEELEAEIVNLDARLGTRRADLTRLKTLTDKTTAATDQGELFMDRYFLDRRTASSTLVQEIVNTAHQAGLQPREHSIVEEPIEGSTDLATRTITGNYEGNYAHLVQLVNAIDRSPRFLIIEGLTAAPQVDGGIIFQIRYRAFVRSTTT